MKKQLLAAAIATILAVSAVSAAVIVDSQTTVEAAKKKKTPSVKKLHDAIAKAYGDNYTANYSLTQDELNERFGLNASWYKAASADVPMMSAHVDTLVIVRSKNTKSKKKIKKALNAYREQLVNDTMQYPANQCKLQASRVYVKKDYVFFITLGFIESSAEEVSEEDQIAAYQEQNQIAIDAIDALFK